MYNNFKVNTPLLINQYQQHKQIQRQSASCHISLASYYKALFLSRNFIEFSLKTV